MDVIQNVTSLLTADLLKVSIGSPTTNTVVAPYFMIPIAVLAYIGTHNPWKLSNDTYNNKNLIYLRTFMDNRIQEQYQTSLHNITRTKNAKVLNKVFVNDTYQLRAEVENVASHMGVHVEYLDMFHRYPVQQHIANYLRTQGYTDKELPRFKQLNNIPMILLNGVEFKGEWEYPFDIKYYKWIRFWTEKYRYKLVEAMHFEGVFPYADYCNMRIVAIPYNNNNNNLALMIVLPNTVDGLTKLLKQLDKHQFKILNTPFEYQNANIDIPIFKVEEKGLIVNVLYKMGFEALFRSDTIFDNAFTCGPPISLNTTDHHVVVVVNGTATSPENVQSYCPDKAKRVIDFKVNRPFLFYILDLETRVPYFSGLVTNFEGVGKVDHSDGFDKDKIVKDTQNCMKIETDL